MKNTLIFCEGKNIDEGQSLDTPVLLKLLNGISGVTIIPVGGKRSLLAFIDGYTKRGGVIRPDLSIGLRDRDFDFPIPTNEALIETRDNKLNAAKLVYATYRTCIENYLLDATLMSRFVVTKGLNIQADISEIMRQSAKDIRYYTASRHALGKVQVPVNIKTSWTNKSGQLPDSLDKKTIIKESRQMIVNYRSPIEKVTFKKFNDAFQDFSDVFEAETHYTKDEYLIYANGKDLAKSFSNQFHTITGRPFPNWKEYYTFAIKEIDFTQFEDFKQLLDLVKS
jgi:Protein of unknown function (DUF4435)